MPRHIDSILLLEQHDATGARHRHDLGFDEATWLETVPPKSASWPATGSALFPSSVSALGLKCTCHGGLRGQQGLCERTSGIPGA